MIARRSLTRTHRRGIALILALVVLGLVGALAANLLRGYAGGVTAAAQAQREAQAEWLATAGIARARAQLVGDTSYTGETWEIAAEELGGRYPGRVVIAVGPVADRPESRAVTIRAVYPWNDDPTRVARSWRVVLPVTTGRTAPGEQP